MMDETKYLDQLGGVLLIAEKDFTLEYCSSHSESILGYPSESIYSTPGFWISKIHAEHKELFKNTIEQIKANQKVQTINYLFLVSTGKYRWVQSRIFVFRDAENREKLSVLTIDVHEQQADHSHIMEESILHTELVKHLSHVFFLITQKGKFIRWNNLLVEVSGYNDHEIESMYLLDLLKLDEVSRVDEMINSAIEDGKSEMDAVFVAKDGSTQLVHFIGARFTYKGEICITVIATDISKQKNTEETLRKSEQRLMTIVQEGSGLLAIVDNRGMYRFVCSSYLKIVGYEVDFLLDKNIFDFFHPEDLNCILEDFLLIKNQKRITTSPYRFKRKDGGFSWMQSTMTNMLDDDNIQGIIVNTIQINSLIETQKALNESNKLYETVNKVTNDAIYDWDIVNDSFTWGEGFSRIFGYDVKGEFTIDDWRQIEHPQDRKHHLLAWDKFLTNSNRYKWYCALRIKHQNGKYIHSEDIGYVIRNSSGVPVRMIGVLRDVSARTAQEVKNEIQYEIAELFAQDLSLEEILTQTSSYISNKFNIPIVEFWLNSIDEQSTRKVAWFSQPEISDFYQVYADQNVACPNGASMPGKLWDGAKVLLWSGSKLKDNFLRKNLLNDLSIESVIGVPLLSKTTSIGQLVFLFQDDDLNNKEWLDTLSFLGKQLGDETGRKIKEIEFELFYSSSPDILAVIGSDGQFVKVNPAFCSLLGYSFDEIKSKSFNYFLHPDDIVATNKKEDITLAMRDSLNALNRYRTKSGSYRWISWSYSNNLNLDNCFFAYGRDVSQIIELQNKLDSAANLSKIGAWEFNVENKQYYWSSMMRNIHGVENDYLVTETSAFSFFRDDFKKMMAVAFERCKNDFEPFDLEGIIITGQGEECWVRIIGSAEVIQDKCFRIFGSAQDIDVQKKNEAKLISLNTQLQKHMRDLKVSNKELEQFAYVASHDLQEPLRMVTSFLSLLDKKYKNELDEKAQSYIRFAVGGAERMRSIILDLLDFSSLGVLNNSNLSQVDLNIVVSDVQILLKKQIEDAGATFDIAKLPIIFGDYSRLRQVFQNLISNALKYRDDNRNLLVSVSSKEFNRTCIISVKDNGIGIDEKYHNKIFELFQRLHNREQYSGNGIGLSITKKIIESLGGKIQVQSKVGEGAMFQITLKKQLYLEN